MTLGFEIRRNLVLHLSDETWQLALQYVNTANPTVEQTRASGAIDLAPKYTALLWRGRYVCWWRDRG